MERPAEEYQVSVEVNNLLRRVKVFVCPIGRQRATKCSVTLQSEGLEIHDTFGVVAKVKWPGFKLQGVSHFDLDEEGAGFQDCRMEDSDKVSLARLPIGPGHEGLFQPSRRSDPGALTPVIKMLQANRLDSGLAVTCRACRTVCHSLPSLKRVLALPSVSWRDDSQDWFCACTSVLKRPELPQELTTPDGHDLFYAHSFVTFDANGFHTGHNSLVKCKSCGLELGYAANRGQSVLLWSDMIAYKVHDDEWNGAGGSGGLETSFRRLVDELMAEVKFLSGKVCLQSCLDAKVSIKMHTLQSSAKFYTSSVSEGFDMELSEVKGRTPIMFCENPSDTSDCQLTFKVNPAMIEAALSYLKKKSNLSLPKNLQFDAVSGMRMSYIDMLSSNVVQKYFV